jgi:L-seryl-tRNA(Ser) seleniumtransferase
MAEGKSGAGVSRRGLLRRSGAAAALGVARGAAEAAPAKRAKGDIYRAIGVRPLVNAKGTFTIITGSLILPEVKAAMEEAANAYVHLDELMEAAGRRLAELTKAEWGIVTAGCAAALTHATAACVAGADPEKMQRLPRLEGLKDEVIIPRHSRNVYDHAVRMAGVKTVEVETPEELEAAINPKTAMIMVLASPRADRGPLRTEAVCAIAKKHGVPVIVDAAAEKLTIPPIHLQKGADMVAYSGGKCIRGPQCAGLLLGRKDLLQAAWINSAPHHAFGRSMKVGKEEIMGMLAAVEAWTKRNHDAEWKTWESWLDIIGSRVKSIPSVRTEILQPEDLSNHAPRLRIHFDAAKTGITGEEVLDLLLKGEPRIILGDGRGNLREGSQNWVTIMPYMMMPGDAKIVADALHKALTNPLKRGAPETAQAAQVAGEWAVRMEYVSGSAEHRLRIEQNGAALTGTHSGTYLHAPLRGWVEGDRVRFRSSHRYEGASIGYAFEGAAKGDRMEGTVDLGEYGKARWTATKAG